MLELERSTRRPRQMNLTPMVDVVFHLLIFFMLTTEFTSIESIELSFPAQQEVKVAPASVVRIIILSDGRFFLGRQETPLDEIKSKLRLALIEKPDQPILLLSDADVDVQRLVSVMDDVYLMGGKNVAVADWSPAPGENFTLNQPMAVPISEDEVQPEVPLGAQP